MSEPQRDRIAKIEFYCPYCRTTIEKGIESGIKIFPIEVECEKNACAGKFKIFKKASFPSGTRAMEFSRARYPSVGPRRVFEKGDFWVLAHEYEEVQPLEVSHLTQFVDKEILGAMLYGFGFDLESFIVILEKDGKEYVRIEPVDKTHKIEDPCKIIRDKHKGEKGCNESVEKLVDLNRQRTEPYTKRCWLGLNKRFSPIIIEDIVVGTLVCGDMELAAGAEAVKKTVDKRISENFPELIPKPAPKEETHKKYFFSIFKQPNQVEVSEEPKKPISFKERTKDELKNREDVIREKTRIINDLAKRAYTTKRREIDGRFIKELSALFDTGEFLADSPTLLKASQKDKLWELLSHIMKRIAEYIQVEEVHFLVTDGSSFKDSTRLVSKAWSKKGANKVVIGLKDWRNIFEDRENAYYPLAQVAKHHDIKTIIKTIGKNLLKDIRTAVVCPIDLHENGQAAILMINRKNDSKEYSEEFQRCVANVAREVAHNVNNALQTIGLEDERHRLKRFIDSTFHTLHQSMYDISMTMQYLELRLEQGKLNEDLIKKTFPEMRRAVTELETKTDLFYSYVNHKKAVYRFDQPFDLKDLINNIIDRFRSTAAKREITIGLEFHPDLIYVFWDKQHIDILLSNLLHNAIKYSHHKEPVNLTVNYDKAFGLVIIKIRNFGFGIPREELDKIFGYGFRSRLQDARRPIQGAGLGLYMAREIVSRHHGAIEAKSIRDKVTHSISEDINWEGFLTIFRIELPIKIDE